jgi:hypothetical protein
MRAFCLVLIILTSANAARADCLHEIGQFREQVDSQNQARPTPQSQAAARELQKLERNDTADEVDCYNTLAKARNILAAPIASPSDDRYARDHRRQ